MTGAAPGDETGRTPTDIPAGGSQVAGETPEGIVDPAEDQGTEAIQVAYCHNNSVSHSWHQSMMNAIAYDKTLGMNVIPAMPLAINCSGPNSLVEGRNAAVQHFLDKTESEWLFFVDTDMGFQADAIEQLLFAADMVHRPVVGGLCFALKHMTPDAMGGFKVLPVPTLFEFAKNDEQGYGFANRFIYPPETLVRVAGTGAAFLLIHRWVLDRLRGAYGDTWFNLVAYGDGTQVSEDLSFCWRLGEQDIPIHVHTGVKVTHHKQLWLSESDYSMPPREPMGKMIAAADGWRPTLGHSGSDRWTGGDKKDAD